MRVKIKPLLLVLALCMAHVLILSSEPKQASASPTASEQPVELWSKTFGGPSGDYAWSAQQTSDGGYILAGGTCSFGAGDHDVWLIKTDSSGNEEWSENFGGLAYEDARTVQQTADGGYILAGSAASFGAGSFDAWLIKTDSSGNEEWNKTFGGSADDFAYSVQQTSDGGYILAGETWSFAVGGKDAWLIKTDSSGNEEWSKTFGGQGGEFVDSVQQTPDGGYILVGSVGNGGSHDALLIKTDSSGNEEWEKTFGGSAGDMGKEVQRTSDGGYILGGMTESSGAGGYDFWLIKTDSSGNEEWSNTFGGADDDEAFSVLQTSDGGYVLTGKTRPTEDGKWDAWLVKTDSNGNEEWNKTFGGADDDEVFSVLQTSDGRYILAGKTYPPGSDSVDAWLVKLGPEENPPVTSPTTKTLASVHMFSSDDGWAVGEDGTIVRWDGSSWSTVTSPTGEFIHSVHMVSPTDGWAVGISSRIGGWAMGTGGRILRWDGSSWSIAAEPTTSSLYSVYMLSPTDGWAVGEYGTILKWDGSSWSTVASPTESSFYSVYMLSSDEGWAVGFWGTIVRWDGSSWSTVASPTESSLLSVYMLSSTDGWAVGYGGTILRWNGTSWSTVTSPTGSPLASIYMLSSTDGWAVGYGGTILRWNGTSWSTVTSHTTNSLYSTYMTSSTDGWAVGHMGTIIRIPPASNSQPALENQKAEGQTDPTDLTTLTPSLSWDYHDANNDVMEAFWIQVGTSNNDNSLWDYTSTRQQELGGAVQIEPFDTLDSFDFDNPGTASVEIDPPGQLHYNNLGGGESWGHIYGWEIPENFTFETKTYFDFINEGHWYYNILNSGTLQFIPGFKRTGLLLAQEHVDVPNVDTFNLIIPRVVKYGEDAEWQTWKFVVTGAGWGAASCDIYLTDLTHTNQLIAEDVACSVSPLPGEAQTHSVSFETDGVEVHVDYCKIYYDSGTKTVELTPSVTYGGSGLSLGTTYHWRVKCYDGYAWSSWASGTFKVGELGRTIQTVDSEGDVGLFASIALDSSGYPHISYYDSTNDDLKYASWTGSSWSTQTVDSAERVGYDTSISLDESGYPHISHSDHANGDLKYARWTGDNWIAQIVDSEGNVGSFTSIALYSSGYAHISYRDDTNGDLKYARWTGSSWDIQTVDSEGDVGLFASIALDENGYAHISYRDLTNADIKYARWTGSSWDIQTVDSEGDTGDFASIALDENGYAHISYQYRDSANANLKYARWTGSSWDAQTVDSEGRVGSFTSIAIDSSGYAHISYRDDTNADLKYTKWIAEDVADTDGDGMPDNWETLYGLDPNDSNDADQDKDGDGYTNLQEYQAETDPSLASSYPGAGDGEVAPPGEGIPVVYVAVGVVAIVAVIGSVFALKRGVNTTMVVATVIVVVVVAAGALVLTGGPGGAPPAGDGDGDGNGGGDGGATGTVTYSGSLSGTSDMGDVSGTFQLTVDVDAGTVSGSLTTDGDSIDVTGTISDGAISIEAGPKMSLSGNVSPDGSSISGTWELVGGLGSGTWSGTKGPGGAPPAGDGDGDGNGDGGGGTAETVTYSGSLSGTFTGMGDVSGTLQLTVNFDAGTVSGSLTIVSTLVDMTGTISDGAISIEETLMGYTISLSGNVSSDKSSVSGTWKVAGDLGSGTWSGTKSA